MLDCISVAARKPTRPQAPLHSVTNLRTPQTRAGPLVPAAEDLSKFTIPKLKLPAAQSARKAAQQPSARGETGAAPPPAAPPQPLSGDAAAAASTAAPSQPSSKPRGTQPDASSEAADAHPSSSSSIMSSDVEHEARTAAPGKHMLAAADRALRQGPGSANAAAAALRSEPQDTSLAAAAAQTAGSAKAAIPQGHHKGLQASGTRRLLPPSGAAANRRKSRAPARPLAPAGQGAQAQLPRPAAEAQAPAGAHAAARTAKTRQGDKQPDAAAVSAAIGHTAVQAADVRSARTGDSANPGSKHSSLQSVPLPSPPPSPPQVATPVQPNPAATQGTPAPSVTAKAAQEDAARQTPAAQHTPASVYGTPAEGADTPTLNPAAGRYGSDSDGDAEDPPGSPEYCPTGQRSGGSKDDTVRSCGRTAPCSSSSCSFQLVSCTVARPQPAAVTLQDSACLLTQTRAATRTWCRQVSTLLHLLNMQICDFLLNATCCRTLATSSWHARRRS